MEETPDTTHDLVMAYLSLRMAIGYVGFFLPVVLAVGALIIFETGMQSSISSYYHTGMGDVFVGSLCAIGLFLLSYRGYTEDHIAGYLGSAFAIGTALFPPAPDGPVSTAVRLVGGLHIVSAAALFITLIYFSLFLFTKTYPGRKPSRRKLQRNTVYRGCGYLMSACILLMIIYVLLPDEVTATLQAIKPIFWLEAILVMAFGFAWLTKGQAILQDETGNPA